MNLEPLALIALALAALPCGLFVLNLFFYRKISSPSHPSWVVAAKNEGQERLSVLIPARNEEANLHAVLESVLANDGVNFEIIVLDDHSTDRTAEIVREFAAKDSRVRLELAPPLPAGWCGKQHACHVLAQRAKNPLLVFMDADVRLTPNALVRMAGFLRSSDIVLASGVPRQELGTFSERLLIPLIHFVLLGYLPMFMMRWTKYVAFSAGCGQLFIARADTYHVVGGHAQIRTTLHDGVKLPRLFRQAGYRIDLFDATDIAVCRMYQMNREVWSGLGKNATEGLASRGAILPMTALLFGGAILPFLLLLFTPAMTERTLILTLIAAALAYVPRLFSVWKFGQPVGAALMHPLGVAALLVIQWLALIRHFAGKPSVWKGRSYNPGGMTETVKAT